MHRPDLLTCASGSTLGFLAYCDQADQFLAVFGRTHSLNGNMISGVISFTLHMSVPLPFQAPFILTSV